MRARGCSMGIKGLMIVLVSSRTKEEEERRERERGPWAVPFQRFTPFLQPPPPRPLGRRPPGRLFRRPTPRLAFSSLLRRLLWTGHRPGPSRCGRVCCLGDGGGGWSGSR